MSDNIVLQKKSQRTAARQLLFVAPLFLANTIFVIGRCIGGVESIPASIQAWIALAIALLFLPIVYAVLWHKVSAQRVCIEDGCVSDGEHSLHEHPISDIVAITGDVGSEKDDFRDSIILNFADGDEMRLYVEDYEEKELLAFLARVKQENPDCVCTYFDVISLESRGLLRFLVSSVEPDNVILKLSKSPFEDTVIQLVRAHEKVFFWLFSILWSIAAVGLAGCSVLIETERRTGVRVWDSGSTIQYLQSLETAASAHQASWLETFQLNFWIVYQTIVEYFTHAGVEFMTTVWLLIGVIALFIPIIRLLSPTFLFVDKNSMGMGTRFIPWDKARKLRLAHGSNTADSLEGHLAVEDDVQRELDIDLRRVTDLKQRQLLLRLVDNYARKAQRNDEFMRTTNTLVDIQFTDIWLDQMDATTQQSAGKEAPSSAAATAAAAIAGRMLADGKYEVQRPLGFGGQGTAYLGRATKPLVDHITPVETADETMGASHNGGDPRAHDAAPHMAPSRQVVIKELVLPNYADVRVLQDATSRFERGASLLEHLRHPQIVRLWEHFVENGRAFLVLEYIEGKNLRQVINENGAFSLEQVLEFGIQLCDILQYLHSQDPAVIHCDFAPDNLILTPGGTLKLVDFDVAQVLDARAYSFIAGRPAYTPPEQFRGQPSTQSDIFALGGILHFLLNGTDPSPLGATGTDQPEREVTEIESLIQQCISFEDSERPASAKEVRDRLRRLAGDTGDEDGGTIIHLAKTELSEIVIES
jgi:hypothetical protein